MSEKDNDHIRNVRVEHTSTPDSEIYDIKGELHNPTPEMVEALRAHIAQSDNMAQRLELLKGGHKLAKRLHRMARWMPWLYLALAVLNAGAAINGVVTDGTPLIVMANIACSIWMMHGWVTRKRTLHKAIEDHAWWHEQLRKLRDEALDSALELVESGLVPLDELPPDLVDQLTQRHFTTQPTRAEIRAERKDFRN